MLIVLGGGVDKKGNMPSWIHARLEKALEEWSKNINSYLITSGKGRGHDIAGSEASSMAKYLAEHGVPESKILIEEKSTSTIENAYFCKVDHLDQLNIKNLTIVTNQFHIERAETIFKFIFGSEYSVSVSACEDAGITAAVHEILIQADLEQSDFLKDKIFNAIEPGNQKQVESFIFNKSDNNAKKWAEYKATSSLYKEVTRLMT